MKCNQVFLHAVGLSFVFTFDELSKEKPASQSHTQTGSFFGENGAHYAVDGITSTCTKTSDIGSTSHYKDVWWKVDLGEIKNIYSIDIQFRNYKEKEYRQRGRFAGFSLYLSNTNISTIGKIRDASMCYKDGKELPPLNFTAICAEYGRYVIFYNERRDGVAYPNEYQSANVFTELCEVIVKGCRHSGVYGNNCNTPCPLACKDSTCDIQNGSCFECKHGVYGDHCNISCPINCKDNECQIVNGTCFSCKPGWTGMYCKRKCGKGWYGVNCSHRCQEQCKDAAICNHVTGQCDKGCKEGWFNVYCSQQCSGHCKDNNNCNHVTGQCDKGCDAGWTGTKCEKECEEGTFGYGCNNKCSGHCLNSSPCNTKTGQCDKGCNPGYTNDDCEKECANGQFGINCSNHCSGHCENNDPCDHVSGVCPIGCEDGYLDEFCNSSCEVGKYGKNCSLPCPEGCNGTCSHLDGSCNNCKENLNVQCPKGNGPLTDESTNNLTVTVGVSVCTCLVFTVGVVIFFFILRLKRKATILKKRESIILEVKPSINTRPSFDHKSHGNKANDNENSIYALPEKSKKGPPTKKNISIRNIMAQISNMSANENAGFKSEYHDISRGELHPCTEAKKPENKVKNRYTTIFPYDHSRIILKPLASNGSGYINANYIEDTRGIRLYIATQGPKPKTIADFWTMIWQEEVYNIVCLTNLTEGAKNKCAQYWPDINDKLQGGTLTVRHLEEKTYAEYIIRRFRIHNKTTRSDRHVTMFHYTTWSDHGVADPLSLVVFHRQVIRATANSAGKYTVVHCSAGVGRTGTYIALDALYREGERTGKINVPMYVRTMRKDRMNMIQGDDQYKLLYLALKDAFHGQNKCVDTEKFLGEYQEQTCYTNCGDLSQKKSLSSDLEELLSLRKEYTQQDYISGRAQISANYTESVLPVEEFMCHLYYMKGYNTYYNAVLIQSFLEKDSLISAQYPLPDNTQDFLRLVKDFDARVVVYLCPLEDIESTSKWFPPENQHKFNGIFYVKNMSSTRSHNVNLTRLNIQPTGFNEMDITLLECPTWGKRLKKGDKRVLLDVVKAVKTEKSDHKGRVLVLSRDGATRCGPFFVVYNVLEQISVDRDVDIFTAVRQIQIRRPECVSTMDEYKLCHDAVAEYLLNDCVYGNC